MAYSTLTAFLTDCADAIRAKKGTTAKIVADNFPTEIANLHGYTKLGETTLTASTTSTSASSAGTLALGSSAFEAGKVLYVRVRDTAGKREGHFYGSDSYFFNYQKANGSTSTLTYAARAIHRYATGGTWGTYMGTNTAGYGVYAYSISSSGSLIIYKRYNANYSLTISGTYKIEAYLLDTPDGVSPFA